MGMNEGDELPMDVSRIAPTTFVGEVVMKKEMTAFLAVSYTHLDVYKRQPLPLRTVFW